MRNRIIPVLLLRDQGLYKSEKFKNHRYLGDPINILKIFNEKEVDELLILDIGASKEKREPAYEFLKDLASEAFMPLGYGGGISNAEQIKRILGLGYEKVCLNSQIIQNMDFICDAVRIFGSSTIVVIADIKKSIWGKYEIFDHVAGRSAGIDAYEWIQKLESFGVGEIVINHVDRDGTMKGYDIEFLSQISSRVRVPIVASGGAGKIQDFKEAFRAGSSAVAAGSFFVYQGPLRAVLISYPSDHERKANEME